jgi:hypothetical protein
MRRLATAAAGLGLLGSALAASACAQSTASPSATTAAARCPRVVGQAQAGRTVTIADHACVTLRLRGGLVWSTPRSSGSAVRVTKAPGASTWYLTGARTGIGTITSGGRPSCAAGQACPAFIVAFGMRVHVVAKAG